ncbi:unnamed protein product [Allacma fusca]|uniref:Uncharacterized protein n=1 Tax=Allacma fusca TaxID=39272 RepID=A0A8J2J448_9HEXA|nr:unnamed protein product [Allacma fusca]
MKTKNWRIPKKNTQFQCQHSPKNDYTYNPNSHKTRRTEKFKNGEVKGKYSNQLPPNPRKSHNEKELDTFNLFFSPGTQVIYISDYERMMMDCEKLTIIQRFELRTTASHASLVPMKFVQRGILHVEANHYERNHFGENMPYNPKAVSMLTLVLEKNQCPYYRLQQILLWGQLIHNNGSCDDQGRHYSCHQGGDILVLNFKPSL